jgi:hypothetical protein
VGKKLTTQQTKEESKKEETVHKFSNNNQEQIREGILVDGKPYYISYAFIEDKNKDFFVTPPIIEDKANDRILKPPKKGVCPYEPYDFTASSINGYYLPKVKQETIDTLYQKVKAEVKLYNEINEMALRLLTADIIGSYFQDRFSTVHYIQVIGDNGTGKSSLGDTFDILGYRPVKVANVNESFWFRALGTVEAGQVTIIAEEVDRIDESSSTMSVLKEGYQPNAKVPRMTNDNDRLEFFHPYCFKILIGEKSLSPAKAKGVLDRIFDIKTYRGDPQLKIKEIRNPQGNKERQFALDRLKELRRMLLLFKLLHFKVPYKEVNVGLGGRDEELVKPLLQLFYTLGASSETIIELEECLQYFLDKKNKDKKDSLEAEMIEKITEYTKDNGYSISSRGLWELITKLDGKQDDKNPDIFYFTEYGKKYINTITKIAVDKLGAKKEHGREVQTILTFDKDTLERSARNYKVDTKIKTEPCDACDACDAF